MSLVTIPPEEWKDFLEAFSERHHRWLVRMEIHDLQTGEYVGSQYSPLHNVELDTEDANNHRINITVFSDHKLIKHILFRPSRLTLELAAGGAEESLNIQSVNTSTTIRFRAIALPDMVDGVA
jgi:Family of unknown function (DUF5335)